MFRIRQWQMIALLGMVALSLGTQAQTTVQKQAAPDDEIVRVRMQTTLGDIVLDLNKTKAPISTENFVQYAKAGFYNGLIFHRVMKTFMIQAGGFTPEMDKQTDGARPAIKNEWRNGLKNKRGTIAMARMGGRADSATSEFFINVVDNPSLNQPNDGSAYAVFGEVYKGMDVVDKIRNTPVFDHPKYPGPDAVTPITPVIIEKVEVLGDPNQPAADAEVPSEPQDEPAPEVKPESTPEPTPEPTPAPQSALPVVRVPDPNPGTTFSPRAEIKTSLGTLEVTLDGVHAPRSVLNFVEYAEAGFYDGTVFHIVQPDIRAIGGSHGPDLKKKADGLRDPLINEFYNGLSNERGTIAFNREISTDRTNPGRPRAEFYLNLGDNDSLDKRQHDNRPFPVFGRVTGGMDVLAALNAQPLQSDPRIVTGGDFVPVKPVVIESVKMLDRFDRENTPHLVAAAEARYVADIHALRLTRIAAAEARQKEKDRILAEQRGAYREAFTNAIARIEQKYGKPMQSMDSGLRYLIIEEGAGEKPAPEDTIKADYRGELLDGGVFADTFKSGEPLVVELQRMIPGWTQALQLIPAGSECVLLLHSDQAYDQTDLPANGDDVGIPANSPLLFHIKLLEVTKAETES